MKTNILRNAILCVFFLFCFSTAIYAEQQSKESYVGTVAVLIDRSGSMKQKKNEVVQFMESISKGIPSNICVAIATFGTTSDSEIQWFKATSTAKIKSSVSNISFSDMDTKYDAASELASRIVKTSQSEVLLLVLITDGRNGLTNNPAPEELIGIVSIHFNQNLPIVFAGVDGIESGTKANGNRDVFLPISTESAQYISSILGSHTEASKLYEEDTKTPMKKESAIKYVKIIIPILLIVLITVAIVLVTRFIISRRFYGYRINAQVIVDEMPISADSVILTNKPISLGGIDSDILEDIDIAFGEIYVEDKPRLLPYENIILNGKEIEEDEKPILNRKNIIETPDRETRLNLDVIPIRKMEVQ